MSNFGEIKDNTEFGFGGGPESGFAQELCYKRYRGDGSLTLILPKDPMGMPTVKIKVKIKWWCQCEETHYENPGPGATRRHGGGAPCKGNTWKFDYSKTFTGYECNDKFDEYGVMIGTCEGKGTIDKTETMTLGEFMLSSSDSNEWYHYNEGDQVCMYFPMDSGNPLIGALVDCGGTKFGKINKKTGQETVSVCFDPNAVAACMARSTFSCGKTPKEKKDNEGKVMDLLTRWLRLLMYQEGATCNHTWFE